MPLALPPPLPPPANDALGPGAESHLMYKESHRTMAGPAFRAAAVRVRVPATSANLGPGFDAFGLALGLYDDVVVRVADSGLHVDIAGEGAETLSRDENHLVVRALRTAFDL